MSFSWHECSHKGGLGSHLRLVTFSHRFTDWSVGELTSLNISRYQLKTSNYRIQLQGKNFSHLGFSLQICITSLNENYIYTIQNITPAFWISWYCVTPSVSGLQPFWAASAFARPVLKSNSWEWPIPSCVQIETLPLNTNTEHVAQHTTYPLNNTYRTHKQQQHSNERQPVVVFLKLISPSSLPDRRSPTFL